MRRRITVDFDDWQITHDLFQSLEQLWCPHTVDCFANYYTAKLPRFVSRFSNLGASGIDFFAQELSSENCLVVPPPFRHGYFMPQCRYITMLES